MATRTNIDRHLAQIQASEHESIENFTGTLVVTLHIAGELVVRIEGTANQRIGLDLVIVSKIIPACSRNAEAMILLIDEVELTEDVDAISDQITAIM
ncbi:hypothetical protein D3C85_1621810 [compost metagenome]